jgi:hypothetical protein
MAADAAIAIGSVLIVPDPCTSVLPTMVMGHTGPPQLVPSFDVLPWYGVSAS